ncbi:DUF6484 domain-containing protein [Variovorax robiniae]|uniref:DUF6484 domain-containing protein n=1 Tax=Variovorax robiniae TaxID=1836199 RepID=A0ABU8XDH4_9BURK
MSMREAGLPWAIPQAHEGAEIMRALVEAPATPASLRAEAVGQGVALGELVALGNDGGTALVRAGAQGASRAMRARSVVDLDASHVGKQVVLMYEDGDAGRPIVMGVVRTGVGPSTAATPSSTALDVDGERLVVSAKEQMVLRCGKASITLTKAGKVLIQGEYVLSHSAGLNRIRGGAIQLN